MQKIYKKRKNFTLDPRVVATLKTVSDITGRPMSQIVEEALAEKFDIDMKNEEGK